MSPKSIQNTTFSKVGHVCKQGAEKHEKTYFSQSLFRSLFESKKRSDLRSDFFLELYLLLPLRLLLKNAPKETFGHTNVRQGSQMSSKRSPKKMQNMTFYQSGQCVSHTVNTMLFLTLALPKCNTYSHIGIKNHENVIQVAPKWAPMDPGDFPLQPLWWFWCASFEFFFVFFRGQKQHYFGALWAGAGGGGRGSSKLQILQILTKDSARPAPPWGVRRIWCFAPCRRPLN